MRSVVLLSGGLDSSVLLAYVGADSHCVFFDYGQASVDREWFAARNASPIVVRICLPKIPVMEDYIFPGRNLMMAAAACSYAVSIGILSVSSGVTATDHVGFPDCRPEFNAGLSSLLFSAYGVRYQTPFQFMTKLDVAAMALDLCVDVGGAWSCYLGGEVPCGSCPACRDTMEALS